MKKDFEVDLLMGFILGSLVEISKKAHDTVVGQDIFVLKNHIMNKVNEIYYTKDDDL